jgi:hypothetical protein
VVWLTENPKFFGNAFMSMLISVPFPAPAGPAMTSGRRPFDCNGIDVSGTYQTPNVRETDRVLLFLCGQAGLEMFTRKTENLKRGQQSALRSWCTGAVPHATAPRLVLRLKQRTYYSQTDVSNDSTASRAPGGESNSKELRT